jgi:hypothetical protein
MPEESVAGDQVKDSRDCGANRAHASNAEMDSPAIDSNASTRLTNSWIALPDVMLPLVCKISKLYSGKSLDRCPADKRE